MAILSVEEFNRTIAGDLLRITRSEAFASIFVRQNSNLSQSEFQKLSTEFTNVLKCNALQGEAFLVLMLHYLGITYESASVPMPSVTTAIPASSNLNLPKREFSKEERRAFFNAVKQGNVEAVAPFIQQGFDLETKMRNQKTALIVAASENCTNMVEYLISAGADINAEDSDHETALSFAIKNRNQKLIELILPKSNSRSLHIGLHACNHTDIDLSLVRRLIEAGVDPCATTVWIPSPINQVIRSGKISLLDAYLSSMTAVGRSIDLNVLMEEALKWYPKIAVYEALIKHGASKTYQDANGRNLISRAITYDDIQLEYTNSVETYVEQERLSMITKLSQDGIDINQGDVLGRTPLHYAVGENQVTIASLLFKLGANPDQQDVYQKSPLQYATEKRYKELVSILSSNKQTGISNSETTNGTQHSSISGGRKISFDGN